MPTTETAVRDRMITVIAALIPSTLPKDRFVEFRNDGDGVFSDWCENSPDGAFRRFQVITLGDTKPPIISNSDAELVEVNFLVSVAYPHNHRAGPGNAKARHSLMEQDRLQIERAIGMLGRANFTDPFPDACWLASNPVRATGETCDYLVITQTMQLWRTP